MLLALGACVFNFVILPRIGGKGIWRPDERERGVAVGILLYPVAVLALVLAFREELWAAAAVWGIMAFGDGGATVAGQLIGGPRLSWNPRKTWAGLVSFVVFGTLGASILAIWTEGGSPGRLCSPSVVTLFFVVTLACALAESIPTTIDDNITVPLVGASLLALLWGVSLPPIAAQPSFFPRLAQGLGANTALAAVALRMGSIDLAGALSAVAIGTIITVGLGLPGLAVMIAFFVVGSLVTRIGYKTKAARGIAQEKGGARGWRNAWANGGVPALLAFVAGAHVARGNLETGLVMAVAYAAAVATAAADTCSSEIGKAYGRRTFRITNLRPVPAGTEGAVSLAGTLGGLGGGAIVASVGAACGLYPWTIAPVVALAGLLGSLAESAIGSVAECRGWLDNDLLNAVNTALGALFAACLLRLT